MIASVIDLASSGLSGSGWEGGGAGGCGKESMSDAFDGEPITPSREFFSSMSEPLPCNSFSNDCLALAMSCDCCLARLSSR